jgi:hypothetical protein
VAREAGRGGSFELFSLKASLVFGKLLYFLFQYKLIAVYVPRVGIGNFAGSIYQHGKGYALYVHLAL